MLGFELLNEESIIHDFDCGEAELNSYLKDLALLFQRRRFGVTIIFFEKGNADKKVIGFSTICPACIQLDSLPEKFLKGPKPNPIPAFRICRLAVDKGFQGKGIGKIIFIHALKKCLEQANQIGGNVILIDAKHEKAKMFYERFGFISIPNNPLILIHTIKYVQLHFIPTK
jgi:GNAT superfamily N-acetyltransferase